VLSWRNDIESRAAVKRMRVNRYEAWPGQACAYKIGEVAIRRARAAAELKLSYKFKPGGEQFPIKEFHSVVLDSGPLPLKTVEAGALAWPPWPCCCPLT
jgi:uncharacterized protein (DUF885 family)